MPSENISMTKKVNHGIYTYIYIIMFTIVTTLWTMQNHIHMYNVLGVIGSQDTTDILGEY